MYILDKDNFIGMLLDLQAFVMFYAPWCKHCKDLMPIWENLASEYNKKKDTAIIAKVCVAGTYIMYYK